MHTCWRPAARPPRPGEYATGTPLQVPAEGTEDAEGICGAAHRPAVRGAGPGLDHPFLPGRTRAAGAQGCRRSRHPAAIELAAARTASSDSMRRRPSSTTDSGLLKGGHTTALPRTRRLRATTRLEATNAIRATAPGWFPAIGCVCREFALEGQPNRGGGSGFGREDVIDGLGGLGRDSSVADPGDSNAHRLLETMRPRPRANCPQRPASSRASYGNVTPRHMDRSARRPAGAVEMQFKWRVAVDRDTTGEERNERTSFEGAGVVLVAGGVRVPRRHPGWCGGAAAGGPMGAITGAGPVAGAQGAVPTRKDAGRQKEHPRPSRRGPKSAP